MKSFNIEISMQEFKAIVNPNNPAAFKIASWE